MPKYKCIKSLELDVFDDDGSFVENKYFAVEVGSVWEKDEEPYRFIAAAESVRLTDSNGRWMEIYEDDLTIHSEHIDA
ncbi:hypothetical protein [Sporosarcina sp. FSL K6-3457]|uniref:hypothetical protein n=1 Tax=Sporosarcina sp. FSL K6-3457 TaxID=2978204 RepID=UPI0030F9F904